MKIAMIGLGKMGSNMVRRLMLGGHDCVVYDQDLHKIETLAQEGASAAKSLENLPSHFKEKTIAWSMLPAGAITEQAVEKLASFLKEGDIIIDGGNSHYKDDVRRARFLKEKKIHYLDVGVSGGVWGLSRGYSLMIGGEQEIAVYLDPIFRTLSPGETEITQTKTRAKKTTAESGYLYCGPAGSGHFVKMIHNGIEYGMMQALAEGFNILEGSKSKDLPEEHQFDFNLTEIAEVWRRGSVISSWLLDLIAISLNKDPHLTEFKGQVPDSGEGRWTIQAAIEAGVPAEVLSTALFVRFRSRQTESFAEKLLSAMRFQFGGHQELQTVNNPSAMLNLDRNLLRFREK